MFIRVLLVLLVLFQLPALAHGGACGCNAFKSTGLGGPIITIPAYTMAKGVTSIGLGMNYLNSGRLSSRQINRVIRSGDHADDTAGTFTPVLSIAHGLTDKFTVALNVPYVFAYDLNEVHDEGLENLGDSFGLGDISLLSQYMFYNRNKTQAALLGGLELPTGPSNIRANNGERFEATNQPGSGSFDPIFGAALSRQMGSFGLDFNTLYKFSTEGSQDSETGDVVNYNLALSYAINHDHKQPFQHQHDEGGTKTFLQKVFPEHIGDNHLAWDLILEANTTWQEIPEVGEVKEANHGGTQVFLTPGLRLTVNENWVYNLAVGFPVIEDYNGDQGGSDLQVFFGIATSI